MRKVVVLFAIFLAGCAASPEKLKTVGASEASRLAKPSKPFSSFSNYRMQSIRLMLQNSGHEGKIAQADVLEKKLREKLAPLFAQW